jgi:nucleoside-diphosphate-sugar epimerase
VTRFVVTGAAGGLGRLVVQALANTEGVDEVVAIDVQPLGPYPGNVRAVLADLGGPTAPLVDEIGSEPVDSIVHLAYSNDYGDQPLLRSVLDIAQALNATHLTVISSAMVYGAWPNNPVPISEDAPLRPNPECDFAVRKADVERMVRDWRDEHPGRAVAVLRPAAAVSGSEASMIGRAVLAAAPIRTGVDDPPVQFVHMDDLASSLVLSAHRHLDGVFNVAADGWLSGDELRALLGARLRLRLPVPLPERLDRLVARRSRRPVPTGLLAYTRFPWAVANDRLKAQGWQPRFGNDQTFVAADAGLPWDSMNARQRQYWSLGLGGAGLFALGANIVWALRRWRAQR